LGHLTCKIVSEMTYNVSSGTLNPTIQYQWPWVTFSVIHLLQAFYKCDFLYRSAAVDKNTTNMAYHAVRLQSLILCR